MDSNPSFITGRPGTHGLPFDGFQAGFQNPAQFVDSMGDYGRVQDGNLYSHVWTLFLIVIQVDPGDGQDDQFP